MVKYLGVKYFDVYNLFLIGLVKGKYVYIKRSINKLVKCL